MVPLCRTPPNFDYGTHRTPGSHTAAHPRCRAEAVLRKGIRTHLDAGHRHELGNLSKGAIYHHFPGKEAILEELTHRDWEASHGLLDELHQRTDLTGLEKIREVIRRSITNETHLNIQRDAAQFLEDPTTLAHNLQTWQTTVADGFHTLIMDGVEDGSITTEYPREAAILLSLLLNYWVACGPPPPTPSPERDAWRPCWPPSACRCSTRS